MPGSTTSAGEAPVCVRPSAHDAATSPSYDPLLLQNQLCFPLYAVSKEIVRRYKPLLDPLGLTYTQYITMMVLWEEGHATVSHLGERLHLDSGTLTPLLKKLEQKGYVTRQRAHTDAREVVVSLTDEGRALREQALAVPQAMACNLNLSIDEAVELKRLLAKALKEQ